ncbi:MAG: IPT/TIG domain-containing protein [Gemmatimonadota bacterium]|nr:IPT/TIG domain-containing protein [Gemmatimonadota bacterium]
MAGTVFSVVNATTINVTTPAGAAGQVDVVVQHPGGNATLTNGFEYVP